jgi:hypothetical protein
MMKDHDLNSLEFYYTNLTHKIDFYFTICTCPIGIVLNLLVFYVFLRKNLNKTNIGCFNQCLAMSHVLTLLFILFVIESDDLFGIDFYTHSNLTCKLIMFSRRIIRGLSPLIETLFTIDRYLNIVYPKKFTFLKKKSNICLSILIVFIFTVLIDTENLLYKVVLYRDRSFLRKKCESAYDLLSEIILVTMRSVIPLSIMFYCNNCIIKKILGSSRLRMRRSSVQISKVYQFKLTILIINVCFMLFNIPTAIAYIIKHVHRYLFKYDANFGLERRRINEARINLIWAICFNISTFYYVIYFF